MIKLSQIIDKAYLAKLNSLSLHIGGRLRAGQAGNRRARAKGSSNEFSDFRQYERGDDVRRIDWNGYARSERLFVKLYTEERQAEINVFVDTSRSMDFGEPNKLGTAKLLAASIAYIALKSTDLVNIHCFSERLSLSKEKLARSDRFFEAIEFLDKIAADGKTDIGAVLHDRAARPSGSGVSFILSDFFCGDFANNLGLLRERRQDVTLLQLLCPGELEPELNGRFRLVDSETGDIRDVIADEALINGYKQALVDFKRGLKENADRKQCRFYSADTSESAFGILSAVL